MDVDDSNVELEDQGQRSRSLGHLTVLQVFFEVTWIKVKGHLGQGQRSMLKVKVKCQGHQVTNVILGLI